MATVYRGRHSTLDRDVAIKVLHPHLSSSDRNRMRFAREAKAVERLRHENILEIFDYSGQDASECYIVTEFVEGDTLTSLLQRTGRLPSEVVTVLGVCVARALTFAHQEGILHRDLKTDNIMLRVDGTLKLMDFGIARFLDESQVTMTGALVGSPAFMSPEQAREGTLDQRSDLFSFGTVLFYLVTGHLPFAGSNPSLILKNVIEGNRPNVSELAPSMSASLADIIERLLSTSADDRFNTASEVEQALLDCLTEVQIDIGAPPWALQAYLEDPDAYDARLDTHLRVALLEQGQRFLERGDHLAALRLLNRLLSIDHDNEEVLALVQNLHGQTGPSGRRRLWLAAGGLAAVGAALAGLWVVAQRPPEVTTEPGEAAELRPVQAAEPDLQVILPELAPQSPASPTQPGALQADEAEAPAQPPEVARRPGDRAAERPTLAPSPRRRITRSPAAPAPVVAPPEAAEHATVVINTHGLAAEVYSGGRRVGGTSEEIKLRPGSHELEIRSPYFHTHTQPVVVSPGERTEVPVTLRVRPGKVVFPSDWPADCRVTLTDQRHQAEDMGTIGSLARHLRVDRPDRPVDVQVACVDGTTGQRRWPHLAGEVRFPAPAGPAEESGDP